MHRDIKSSNILVDTTWNAKVSDFGLAKLLGSGKSHVTTRVMGTFGYIHLCLHSVLQIVFLLSWCCRGPSHHSTILPSILLSGKKTCMSPPGEQVSMVEIITLQSHAMQCTSSLQCHVACYVCSLELIFVEHFVSVGWIYADMWHLNIAVQDCSLREVMFTALVCYSWR